MYSLASNLDVSSFGGFFFYTPHTGFAHVWLCVTKIDLFHKWRLLHGNEARMLFSRWILWLVLRLGLGFGLFYYLAILAKIKHKNMSVW